MLFNSLTFAIFFAIVYSLYLTTQNHLRLQNILLLIASYFFYGWWNPYYIPLLFGTSAIDYLMVIMMDRSRTRRKLWLIISLVSNFGFLGFFKYSYFITNSANDFLALIGLSARLVDPVTYPNALLHLFGVPDSGLFARVILPIGISFHTFQSMSYTIDAYRGKIPTEKNFLRFMMFVSFFPQLVAGPIERATNLLPQCATPRTITRADVSAGLHLIVWGLFLKMFVADNVAKIVDAVFTAPPPYNGSLVLFGAYAFAFQIYGDFAGYSFVAIGTARMMGFRLMYNFKRPYFSLNIAEFWRRWHISLSSWFRDYMFSPYYMHIDGADRFKGLSMKARHNLIFLISVLVTDLILGFWHGANWTFGLFGLYHGFIIWVYYYFRWLWDKMPRILQVILTFHLACGGWLIFRAHSLTQLGQMVHGLLFNFRILPGLGLNTIVQSLIFYCSVLIVVELIDAKKEDTLGVLKMPILFRLFFYVLLFCLTLAWGEFGERQFIYFQF